MFYNSTDITQDLTYYLVNKAAKSMCYEQSKKQAIKEITKQDARNFSTECTQIIVNLYNLKPNSQQNLLGKQEKLLTPTCHKQKRPFQYTRTYNTTKLNSPLFSTRFSNKRIQRLSTRAPISNQTSFCIPLVTKEDFDQQQSLLRQKKQKISNLQTFFKKNEKQQKYRYKIQKISKNPFTTDYNGDKLQIKKMSRTANLASSFIIDVNTKIREQRQEKQRFLHLQTNQSLVKIDFLSKQNQKNSHFRKTAHLDLRKNSNFILSQASNRKNHKESLKLQQLTFKDFQKDLSSQQKSNKKNFKKYKQNTRNLSTNDCIKLI